MRGLSNSANFPNPFPACILLWSAPQLLVIRGNKTRPVDCGSGDNI